MIEITKQVRLNMAAADWDLYDAMDGAEEAAAEINEAIESAFNAGGKRSEVRKAALAVMEKKSRYGATDTEPLYALQDVLDRLFGE